MKMALI
jgi:hypothetical protein